MTDLFDWTQPAAYPDCPGWKEPTTSRDAAERVASEAKTLRDNALKVLRAAWPAGLTAHEVAARMGRSIMSIAPRLSELRKVDEVMPARREDGKPLRRPNESGCTATVWVCRRPEREV